METDTSETITLPTRGLSLWQPWASAIALGLKTIETRGWEVSYRGLIAIHAAKHWTAQQREFLGKLQDRFPQLSVLENKPPLGCIVAIARLVDCRKVEDVFKTTTDINKAMGDYNHGRFAWLLSDIVPIQPMPYTGRQNLFAIPVGVKVQRLRQQS